MGDHVFVWTLNDVLGAALLSLALLTALCLAAWRAWVRLVCAVRGHRWELRERYLSDGGAWMVQRAGRHVCTRCGRVEVRGG